jgi:hypothetical protein
MRRREFITLLGGAAVSPLAGRALTAIDKESVRNALIAAGWPHRANVAEANLPALTFLVFLLDLYLAIVFAPIAALMAELFPARLRYTSTSLPFHLGAGWIGRFLPSASPHSTSNGNLNSGLRYPVACLAIAAAIGFAMPETHKGLALSEASRDQEDRSWPKQNSVKASVLVFSERRMPAISAVAASLSGIFGYPACARSHSFAVPLLMR